MSASEPSRRRTLRTAAALVLIAVTVGGSAGCGSSSAAHAPSVARASHHTRARSESSAAAGLQGGFVVNPPVSAPALTLTNYATGRPFSISSVRGRAVFVTFVYTHCPDVCPVIVSELAAAQRALGALAGRARFVAVTIDPRRDTPTAVRAFLAARGAIGRVQFLLGSHTALARVWKAWHVRILPGGRATLAHTSVVYGLDAHGLIRVMYPASLTPAEIVHDVRLLVRS
jgi:protein SCO1/2